MRMVTDRIDALLADRGYDTDAIRDELVDANVEAVILAKANRRNSAPRNCVERLFNKLKNWRRIAMRHDKTTGSYPSFVNLASALPWLSLWSFGLMFIGLATSQPPI